MTINERRFMEQISGDWYWLVADQTREFQDLLLVPIRNWEQTMLESRRFFEYRETVAPDASVELVFSAFREMLNRLEISGEDTRRLMLWYAAHAPDLFRADPYQEENPINLGAWVEFFDRCVRGKRNGARHLDERKLAGLIETYQAEVHDPYSNEMSPRVNKFSCLDPPAALTGITTSGNSILERL
jgi:hypothetical protein